MARFCLTEGNGHRISDIVLNSACIVDVSWEVNFPAVDTYNNFLCDKWTAKHNIPFLIYHEKQQAEYKKPATKV